MRKVVFSKYSNERARRFALRTDIAEENGHRMAVKTALYPEGRAHIHNIARWESELCSRYEGTGISLNHCREEEDSLIFEYLEGNTLENVLDGYFHAGNLDALIKTLFAYLEEVKKGFTLPFFTMTPEFREVFGEVSLPENLLSADVADVDMVLNNVVLHDGWTLIDYEWTFAFPVPYHFVVYRILKYYLEENTARDSLYQLNLYEKAGISEEEREIYAKMEEHFQADYVLRDREKDRLHVPIRDLYQDISPGSVELGEIGFQEMNGRAARTVQLYQAPEIAFSEKESEKRMIDRSGIYKGIFSVKAESSFIRLDPCSKCCIVRNLSIVWGREVKPYMTNGILTEDGSIFFGVDDPQIIVKRPKNAPEEVEVSYEVEFLSGSESLNRMNELYRKQQNALNHTREVLQQKEHLIHEMENTKVWKAYRRIKKG